MAKKKIGRSVVYVAFNATGITRLSSAEHIQRFHTLFEGVSADLVPTHLFFHESRGGARPFDLEETKSLDSWKPLGGAYIELKYKGAIKGWMNVGIGHASPPRKNVYMRFPRERYCDFAPRGDAIGVVLDLAPISKRRVFEDVLRLFRNAIGYTQARHGNLRIGVRNTSTDVLGDEPERTRPDPVEWNGVRIGAEDTSGGGPAINCLPRFESWLNVLGPEYVKLLGRDKLLSLDIYDRHEDSENRLWLQMTERPEQMHLPETKEYVMNLMKSFDAPDVFCRPPQTKEERRKGVTDYRRPDFDWSHIPPLVIDNDPYSKHIPEVGLGVTRKLTLRHSLGVSRQLLGNQTFWPLVIEMIKHAVKIKGTFSPFGMALTEDGELLKARRRSGPSQHRTDVVVETLAQLCEEHPIRAIGVCESGAGPVPGLDTTSKAFKFHLESTTKDAHTLYLPFVDHQDQRTYGALMLDPGERVIFVDT